MILLIYLYLPFIIKKISRYFKFTSGKNWKLARKNSINFVHF